MRILVVEDSRKVADFIVKGLREESYAVDRVADGREALETARATAYDAIILDVMLPGMNGMEVVSELRKCGNHTPVLMLTVKAGTADKVAGLDAGADDYLAKPFAFDELLARVRALMRRGAGGADYTLHLADLTVDCAARKVRRGQKDIELTQKEYALLVYLLRNKDRVMTRTSILDHVWDMQYDGGTNIVDVLVRYLRRKVDDDFEPKLIQTVRGVGYVMRLA